MIFSISYDHVTCDSDIYDYHVTHVTLLSHFLTCVTIICDVTSHSLSKSKIKKSEN